MPEPKKRTTKSRQGMRRSHISLKPKSIKVCSHCGEPALAHLMCKDCGYYKGRKVIDYTKKAVKVARSTKSSTVAQAKADKAKEKAVKPRTKTRAEVKKNKEKKTN